MLSRFRGSARPLAVLMLAPVFATLLFATLLVVAPTVDARMSDRQPYTTLPLFKRGRQHLQLGKTVVGEIRGIQHWEMEVGYNCDVQIIFGVILKMRDCVPESTQIPWGLTQDDVEDIIYSRYGVEDIKFTWWALKGHILLIICAVLWPIGAYARWKNHRKDMERRVSKYR